jgi:hypothetical protein
MFQPLSVILSLRYLYIERHEKSDYYNGTPWRERLNPLRYEVLIKWGGARNGKRIYINKGGKFHRAFSNFIWRLRGNK